MILSELSSIELINARNDFSVGAAKIGEKQSRQSNSKYNFMQLCIFRKTGIDYATGSFENFCVMGYGFCFWSIVYFVLLRQLAYSITSIKNWIWIESSSFAFRPIKPCPHWRLVAEFAENANYSRRKRRLSPNSAMNSATVAKSSTIVASVDRALGLLVILLSARA